MNHATSVDPSPPHGKAGIYIWVMSDDDHAADLVDVDLAGEIELVSDLVVAASTSTRHFTRDEVDALLGISPAQGATPGDKPVDDRRPGSDPVG